MNDRIPQHENSLAKSIVWTVCTTFAHFIAAVVLLGAVTAALYLPLRALTESIT